MYKLLDNRSAFTFDLYSLGQLVASLHYSIDEQEIMFVYCEAIEMADADRHCQKLMQYALDEGLNRRLKITITCPIALEHLRASTMASGQERHPATQRG